VSVVAAKEAILSLADRRRDRSVKNVLNILNNRLQAGTGIEDRVFLTRFSAACIRLVPETPISLRPQSALLLGFAEPCHSLAMAPENQEVMASRAKSVYLPRAAINALSRVEPNRIL